MTSFSLRSAGKRTAVVLAALMLIVGCGSGDGTESFADGKAAYEEGNFGKAAAAFAECLEKMPDNVDALVYFALAKTELGELRAADEALARANVLAGEDADVRLLSAQLAWRLEDYSRARAGYKALAEDAELDVSVRSRGWTGLGIVEMSENNPQLSRVAFLRAIRLDRRNASAWYHLAMLYRNSLSYLDAALEQFEIFVRLDEMASPRVQRVQRQVIPELKEQIAVAATSRPNVASRNSTACSTAMSKADAAWKKGQFKTALKFYQEAQKADPISYPATMALAKAYLKVDTTRAGQQKAFEQYKLACKLKPMSVSTYLTAGKLAMQIGSYGQAVEIYSRAVAAAPTSLEALDGFIGALRKVGNRGAEMRAYQLYRDSLKMKKSRK